MATTTPNLGLVKPATTESVDLSVINRNMDKVDSALGVSVGIVDIQCTASNGSVTIATADLPADFGDVIMASTRYGAANTPTQLNFSSFNGLRIYTSANVTSTWRIVYKKKTL